MGPTSTPGPYLCSGGDAQCWQIHFVGLREPSSAQDRAVPLHPCGALRGKGARSGARARAFLRAGARVERGRVDLLLHQLPGRVGLVDGTRLR